MKRQAIKWGYFFGITLCLTGLTSPSWGKEEPKREKQVLVLQNHDHDPLGNLEPVLQRQGFSIHVLHLPKDEARLASQDPLAPDLVVVLGGSMGAYQTKEHPFLQREIEILQQRLKEKRPSLGICLGAQLMAAALGARVYSGPVKELGWHALQATPEGLQSPLAPLLLPDSQVYQSHGDHYDAPPGATILAKTPQYGYQSFSVGTYAIATQFHPEVTPQMMLHWEWFQKLPNTSKGNEKILEVMNHTSMFWKPMQPRIEKFYLTWLQQAGLL